MMQNRENNGIMEVGLVAQTLVYYIYDMWTRVMYPPKLAKQPMLCWYYRIDYIASFTAVGLKKHDECLGKAYVQLWSGTVGSSYS